MSTSSSARPLIVVGSGLAGLSASYEAVSRGVTVNLLDRAPKPGGNSIKASSGINGAGTRFQKAQGIESDTLFYDDSVRSAGQRFINSNAPVDRETLISKLTTESADAVNWLVDDIGVDLSVVAPLGGHSIPRTHRGGGKTPPGAAIIFGLLGKLKEQPNFKMTNEAEVKSLLTDDDDAVKGVEYVLDGQTHTLEGNVMFASGGFAGDATGLLARYRPDLEGIPSTNEARPGSHDILAKVGAELVDMDSVQIHPTGFVDPKSPNTMLKFLAAEMLRGEGGILLDSNGKRFVNEMDTREHVSDVIMKLPQRTDGDGVIKQWDVRLILDPGACEVAASHVGFYEWKGLVKRIKVKDLDETAIESLDKYSSTVAEGKEDEFGRKSFGHWRLKPGQTNREEEICVGHVTPIVHFTMGGVAINGRSQVLRLRGGKPEPIPGLLAAGEITGGVHGDNRLGGSSLLEYVVFGRTAGAEAAKLS